jgi:hypothetical protein
MNVLQEIIVPKEGDCIPSSEGRDSWLAKKLTKN